MNKNTCLVTKLKQPCIRSFYQVINAVLGAKNEKLYLGIFSDNKIDWHFVFEVFSAIAKVLGLESRLYFTEAFMISEVI